MDKKCVKCGANLTSDSQFCPECGARQNSLTCAKCGAPLTPNDAFCSECGTPNPAAQAAPVYTTPVVPTPPAPPAKKWTIPKIIGAVVGALIIIFITVAIFGGSSDNKKPAAQKPAEQAPISVKADKIMDDYIRDQSTGEKTYKGKKVQVTGKVISKNQYNNSQAYNVMIANKYAAGKDYSVSLAVDPKMVSKINQLKVGDFVSAEGTCEGIVQQKDLTDIAIQISADKINE